MELDQQEGSEGVLYGVSCLLCFVVFKDCHTNGCELRCSAVTIAPPPKNAIAPAIPFNQRPDIFVAQLDNKCKVEWDHDVLYPEPGPDVDVTSNIVGKSQKMSYDVCKPVNGIGNHPRGKSAGAAAAQQQAVPVPIEMVATTTTKSAAEFSILPYNEPTNLVESPDNTCGKGTNFRCATGQCCSIHGYVSSFI